MGLHSAMEFTGVLQVTNHEKFRDAFTNGIGSGKAFGFGMLALS
jgi:CRISPR system Cascade subunit CasE